jgi:hypothetical protein
MNISYSDQHTWGPGGEDIALWEEMLGYATSKALDHGVESSSVLDGIASFVSCFQTPGAAPGASTRLVDLLFTNLEAPEMRDLPLNVLELASETMKATYPPEPMNYQVSMWMVRSLAVVVEHCPLEFCLKLLQTIQEGLSSWLADESVAWLENDMTYDVGLFSILFPCGLTDGPSCRSFRCISTSWSRFRPFRSHSIHSRSSPQLLIRFSEKGFQFLRSRRLQITGNSPTLVCLNPNKAGQSLFVTVF